MILRAVFCNWLKKAKIFALILTLLFGVVNFFVESYDNVTFQIDASTPGAALGNKVSNLNQWSWQSIPSVQTAADANQAEFVEYIQIMQATGGCDWRDLFVDPYDTSTMTDYDFTVLLQACESILLMGAKPHIKTGNVPMKMSKDYEEGYFGVNLFPPDDYDVYYDYIYAIGEALVERFGRDEVLTWRFGCMTEYENKDWFMVPSGDAEQTLQAFCKLYDYTVAALQAAIGETVTVGAHSMTVAEGLWDERDFITHCATGTNYKTGKTGSRLCFLNVSFYDSKPGKFNGERNLPQTIAVLRDKAERLGLTNLTYGVDEGRILSGVSGAGASDLNLRICGYTYQAAYDARLIRQMVEHDIEYFSSWGYFSGGAFYGYPTVSYHVANRYYAMSHAKRVAVKSRGNMVVNAEKEAIAAFDEETQTLYVMAYNFKNKVDYRVGADMTFVCNAPQFANKELQVTAYVVDDDANYFDDWQRDRQTYGIGDDCFWWSPDDPAIDTDTTLHAPWAKELYFNELRDKYIECAKLVPTASTVSAENGRFTLQQTIDPNAVLFYVVQAK